ncbi:MAG: hypothetical protein LQ351_001001 [Letrouitia transgressa]|nr:MAG: hypothetical protein LQ351_001001 [Letrouitia transgressa]
MTEMQNGSPENGPSKNNKHTEQLNSTDSTLAISTTASNTNAQSLLISAQAVPELQNLDSDFPSTNFEDGPPPKRPRLTQIPTMQNSPTRSKLRSPPWKKFEVEGPSSFEEAGRRKSSRTNRVPLELQPPSDKRQTRAAQRSPHISKSKYSSAARYESTPAPHWSSQTKGPGRNSNSTNKSTFTAHRKPPVRTPHQIHVRSESPVPLQNVAKSSHKRKVQKVHSKDSTASRSSLSPHQTRRTVRKSSHSIFKAKKEPAALENGWYQSDDGIDDEAVDEEDYDDQVEDVPLEPNQKPQRLNLKVHLPSVKIQHPEHVLAPRRFLSFRDWVEHEGSKDEINRKTQSRIEEEAGLQQRITEAATPGGLLSAEKCSIYAPEMQEEPPRQYAHHDHLVAHAIYFHRLMHIEQTKHIQKAKILAREAAEVWKLRQPKTKEEREQEKEARYKAVHKQVLKDLVLKWEMVAVEVKRRRLQRWEEEQQLLGKEALNKVLEQSSQLLDRRRRRSSSSATSGENERGSASEGSESESSTTESQDEVNMSSSGESESEEFHTDNVNDDDEGLTQRELVEKYSKLPDSRNVQHSASDNVEPEALSPSNEVNNGAGETRNGSSSSFHGAVKQEQPQAALEDDEIDNDLINESDRSTDMGDDMGDSDDVASSDEDDTVSRQSDSSEGEHGLLGFFDSELLKDHEPKSRQPIIEELASDGGTVGEVSCIPDATQVQTPSASNSEEPLCGTAKPPSPVQTSHQTNGQINTENGGGSDPLKSLMNIDTINEDQRASLPNTPVSTNPLKTAVPSLLRGTLREYQHFGLDWLAGLYANNTNGILADEMGLGKTIQTIALLAHLAVEHEVWGPHLIVVPTSVMLNWEMEFKKFLPGFKVLTYYGTQEERKQKRQGWISDSDKWNVWITSYQLALKDDQVFKRREWHYMVLDEAHNIKNFRSKRWQTLLTFNTRARLLLTGTPLQNNLTELWSLLFFLMPADSAETGTGGFADLQEFSNWFRKPVEHILEHGRETMDDDAKAIVSKLHKVLRPYLLRRLKADVEKQMPGKFEHVIYCRLSKRQRYLYDGFISRAQTRETLASGNYLSIINCLMQLRKVCNHPDLFETRQIVTSFSMPRSAVTDFEIKELLVRRRLLQEDPMKLLSLRVVNLLPGANEQPSALDTIQRQRLGALGALRQLTSQQWGLISHSMDFNGSSIQSSLAYMENVAKRSRFEELRHAAYLTSLRSQRRSLYSNSLAERLRVPVTRLPHPPQPEKIAELANWLSDSSSALGDMVLSLPRRAESLDLTIQKFACVTPAVIASDLVPLTICTKGIETVRSVQQSCSDDPFHQARMRLSIAFPDKRLLQYDCGKLQRLDSLLRTLQSGGHRALIFTQMTKVLDILEQFLNIHGHRYLRLDGSTKIEQRQILTERFNNDNRILVFILSSRSGGLGINLTGADSVIFYDLDWNPAMDKQCQDRCHRIGQTRDVHIYRFVSEYTIEANILRKANQKRMLDDVVIQEGEFTTDYFNRLGVRDMLEGETYSGDAEADAAMDRVLGGGASGKVFEQVEDQEDIAAAKIAERELVQQDAGDFEDKNIVGSSSVATPKTPGPPTPGEMLPPPRSHSEDVNKEVGLTTIESGFVLQPDALVQESGEEEADEAGHVDSYFLRYMEWELEQIATQLPTEKFKKKAKKVLNGK